MLTMDDAPIVSRSNDLLSTAAAIVNDRLINSKHSREARPKPIPSLQSSTSSSASVATPLHLGDTHLSNDVQKSSSTSPSPSRSPSPGLALPLIDSIVSLMTRLTSLASLPHPSRPPDVHDSTPPVSLQWLRDELQRMCDHFTLHPPNSTLHPSIPPSSAATFGAPRFISPSPAILAMSVRNRTTARSIPSDDGDGLDGVEDARVESLDDMTDPFASPRRSSAAKRPRRPNLNSHERNLHQHQNHSRPNLGPLIDKQSTLSTSQSQLPPLMPSRNSNLSKLPNVVPELPLDDDPILLSARSSQAAMDRPQFKLPLGSPANSYLTQKSSWKSLGQGEANKLHRDYSKIFKESGDGKASQHPGESSIEIAGGDLYNRAPIAERWNIAHKIGEGGYSVVRLATRNPVLPGSPSPEKIVSAIKVISKKSLDLYNDRMVSREVFSFRLLDMAGGHANIVELYEVSEDEDNVYLVMEFLEGGELFARISERGQYTERDAANLVVSMLASLAFCHRLNLTHRDVKPENFVFASPDSDGVDVKLTDFGIAHYSEDPSALCKTLCGTPLYVAPEVLLRQPYGPEADLWSLGVIVYIMLVGYPPFDDNDLVQLVKKIKYRPVKFDGPEWMLISEEGKQFLSNLLDKDASNRMTAQQALEHEWLKNNCQAATTNVLIDAQTNIKSFVSRKRWKAAIQGVKAMNRIHKMVTLTREGRAFDELDDISAEKVEDIAVSRAGNDTAEQASSSIQRTISVSSSSSSELAYPDMQRQAPIKILPVDRPGDHSPYFGATSAIATPPSSRGSRNISERGSLGRLRDDSANEGPGSTAGVSLGICMNTGSTATIRSGGSAASGATTSSIRGRTVRAIRRVSLTRRRRASSTMTGDTAGVMAASPSGREGSSPVLLAMDPAFESSDDSHKVERIVRQLRRRGAPIVSGKNSGLLGRTETSPIVGANDPPHFTGRYSGPAAPPVTSYAPTPIRGASLADSDSGRVGRTLTRAEGNVVRKMSSHARKLVGRSRRTVGVVSEDRERAPVLMTIGDHRKHRRFPWLFR